MCLGQKVYITTKEFIAMFFFGAENIIANETYLNELNFFPVSDHDTGTNLSSLMHYLQSSQYPSSHFKDLFAVLSDASLIGAAGNSGMIFSAFLGGFSYYQQQTEQLSLTDFIACLQQGAESAYQSVLEPIEGTMLTAMLEWAKICKQQQADSSTYLDLFNQALPLLRETIQTNKIEKHSEIKNTDAGAVGFLLWLEGMQRYLQNPHQTLTFQAADSSSHIHHDHEPEISSAYKYCFDTVILNDNATVNIKDQIKNDGDCLVINKNSRYTKIHIHTNDPLQLTKKLMTMGKIVHQKMDDIQTSLSVPEENQHQIALITDSTADLPQDYIDRYSIAVLPITVKLNDNHLIDRATVQLSDIYINNEKQFASTAVPSAQTIQNLFKKLAAKFKSIIVITVSSKMSSLFQQVYLKASQCQNIKITVIDSLRNSAAHGLLVMKAAAVIHQGKSHDDVVAAVKAAIDKTKIIVSVGDFKTMAKSGRAPSMLLQLVDKSQFKPLIGISDDGKTRLEKIVFGAKNSENKLIEKIISVANKASDYVYGVVHSEAAEQAQRIGDLLTQKLKNAPIFIQETSCSIGIHAGKGCVAVAIMSDTL